LSFVDKNVHTTQGETMSPWDPRTAIFAKHAQHVVLIHFPIALFIAGVVLDFIATRTHRKDLALVAYCNFYGALLTAVPTVLTGLLAWQWELEGRRLKGNPPSASALRVRVSNADRGGLVGSPEMHTAWRQTSRVTVGTGDPGRGAGGHDWSSGRIPQWGKSPLA
jgi:hypothetical protein